MDYKIYDEDQLCKIKEAAQLLLDLIRECPGMSDWMMINSVRIHGDIGYAMEFLEEITMYL